MMRRLLALAFLLSPSLLACGGGTGDIPAPGCTSVQTTNELTFPPPLGSGAGDTLQCLDRAPTVATNGEATCLALHATKATGAACTCPADQGLQNVSAEHKNAVGKFFDASTGTTVMAGCVCEIKQITGDDAPAFKACTMDPSKPLVDDAMQPVNGYCYVDPENPSSNPALVALCPTNERRGLRFVGRPATQEAEDISVLVICGTALCEAPLE